MAFILKQKISKNRLLCSGNKDRNKKNYSGKK